MKINLFLLLIVFSIIIAGEMAVIGMIYFSKTVLLESISANVEETNMILMNRIDNYVAERTVNINNLAQEDALKNAVLKSNSEFQAMNNPEQYIDSKDAEWTSAPEGHSTPFMYNLLNNSNSERLREVINYENTLFRGKVFSEIFVTNSYGANVAETDITSDYRQNDEAWWQEAKLNGWYVGDITYDNSSATVSIPIAKRINDNNGNFIGVIKGTIGTEEMINTLKTELEVGTSPPEEYGLIDTNGLTYFNSHNEKESNQTLEISEKLSKMENTHGHFMWTEPENGTIDLVAYTKSSTTGITPSFGWILITEYNSRELLKPISNLAQMLLSITISTVIGASIITFILSQRLSKPISKMEDTIKRFSNGEDVFLEPSGPNEIMNLGMSMNSMMSRTRESEKQLAKYELKYRLLFDFSPLPLIVVDNGLLISDANVAFTKVFGYSINEICNKPVSILVAEKSLAKFVRTNEAHPAGINFKFEKEYYWCQRKDGSTFPSIVNLNTMFDNLGNFMGHIVLIKNIEKIEDLKSP